MNDSISPEDILSTLPTVTLPTALALQLLEITANSGAFARLPVYESLKLADQINSHMVAQYQAVKAGENA
jgi:hypothetical protein